MGLHRVGVLGPFGLARCEAGCGVLPDCRTVSLLGVLVLWVEPIFLGMDGHVSGHHLVCRADLIGLEAAGGLFGPFKQTCKLEDASRCLSG